MKIPRYIENKTLCKMPHNVEERKIWPSSLLPPKKATFWRRKDYSRYTKSLPLFFSRGLCTFLLTPVQWLRSLRFLTEYILQKGSIVHWEQLTTNTTFCVQYYKRCEIERGMGPYLTSESGSFPTKKGILVKILRWIIFLFGFQCDHDVLMETCCCLQT